MLKTLLSLSLSIVLAVAPSLSWASQFTPIRQATRMLVGSNGTCSAVVIKKGVVLTAAHCLGIEDLKIEGNEVKNYKAIPELDIALIKAPVDCPCVPLAEANAYVDDKVSVVGYPLSLGVQFLTEGRVQGIIPQYPFAFAFTAPVMFGNSGGGVFKFNHAKERWELVGIVSAMAGGALGGMFPFVVPHMGIAISVDSINKVL